MTVKGHEKGRLARSFTTKSKAKKPKEVYMAKFKGTLVECIKDFALRIRGNFRYRNNVCALLGINSEVGHRWFDKLVIPKGVNLLKLYLLMRLNGYQVVEAQKIHPKFRELGEWLAMGVLEMDVLIKALRFSGSEGVLTILTGRRDTSHGRFKEIEATLNDGEFRESAAKKLQEWRQTIVLKDEQTTAQATVPVLPEAEGKKKPLAKVNLFRAKERAEIIKHLLLVLEADLAFFRDGKKEDRDAFRSVLDNGDVGYISSLLGMLEDEGMFQRWLALTTHRFGYFQNRKERQ